MIEVTYSDLKLLSSMTMSRCSVCLCIVTRGDQDAHTNYHNYGKAELPERPTDDAYAVTEVNPNEPIQEEGSNG